MLIEGTSYINSLSSPNCSVRASEHFIVCLAKYCNKDTRPSALRHLVPIFWSLLRDLLTSPFLEASLLFHAFFKKSQETLSAAMSFALSSTHLDILLREPTIQKDFRSPGSLFFDLALAVREHSLRWVWVLRSFEYVQKVEREPWLKGQYLTSALRLCCEYLKFQAEHKHKAARMERLSSLLFPLSSSGTTAQRLYESLEEAIDAVLDQLVKPLLPSENRKQGTQLFSALLQGLRMIADTDATLELRFSALLRVRSNTIASLMLEEMKELASCRGSSQCYLFWSSEDCARILDTRMKQEWIRYCFRSREEDDGTQHEVVVQRGTNFLTQAIENIGCASWESLLRPLAVTFEGEEGKGPGLLREFFALVSLPFCASIILREVDM